MDDDPVSTGQTTGEEMGDKLFLGMGVAGALIVIVGSTIAYFSDHPERTPQVATAEQWQFEKVTCTWTAPSGVTWDGARIMLSRENEPKLFANSSMREKVQSVTMTRLLPRGKKVFVEFVAHKGGNPYVACVNHVLQGSLICTVGGNVVETSYAPAAVPECTQQFVVP